MESVPHNSTQPAVERTRSLPFLLFAGFLLIGLCLRFAYIRLIDTPPFSDMADYETMALNLLEGRGLAMDTDHLTYRAYRPPAYPLFIALVYRLFGMEPTRVYQVQGVLSALSALLVYGLAKNLFRGAPPSHRGVATERIEERGSTGRWIGLTASSLYLFDETTIFFSGQLLSETLFIFLVLLWCFLLVRSSNRPHVGIATLLGFIGGATILTRPLFGPILLFGAYWYFRRSQVACNPPPSDWRKFSFLDSPYAPPLAMLVYAGMLVSLWGLRNYAVLGTFVPTSTNGGVNFYLGHHSGFGYDSFGNKEGIRRYLRSKNINDEVTESEFFTLQGLKFIQENPMEDFKNNLKKIYYLYLAPAGWESAYRPWKWWNYLESPYRPWPWENNRRKLRFWRVYGVNGEEALPTFQDWFWREGRLPLINWGWPILYLTVVGVFLAIRRRENIGLPLGILLLYTLTLMVYFTNARFRTPALPFLYLFTAYGIVALSDKAYRKFGPRPRQPGERAQASAVVERDPAELPCGVSD